MGAFSALKKTPAEFGKDLYDFMGIHYAVRKFVESWWHLDGISVDKRKVAAG